ncbi:hypothetical protein O7623_18905 [Solwaraspora sp. WMMD791]|uniref:hypothetical protein n=1 Tax=Solwaraspora sp. WMMD791 TaxID=3016086 RepID=UPI00249CAA55|nr:hypothetical protein [Solwaraspora sp. WMMD791]WFE25456.1 hypothetical protein O7623_18905 [Solwaraspora sp. WMMD791]
MLRIHTTDLFVIAGLPVPDGLASAWPTSPWNVDSIVRRAVRMDGEHARLISSKQLSDVVAADAMRQD